MAKHGLILLLLLLLLCGCAAQVQTTGSDPDSGEPAKRALALQRLALTPKNGGRLVDASLLEPGDIILSAGKGMVSVGIRVFTIAPVSHSVLYIGEGDIVEAVVGQGVRRRSLQESLDEDTVAVAFRAPDLTPEQGRQISAFAQAQVGTKYNALGVLLQAPFSIEKRICELPILPTNVRDFCIRGVASIQLGVVSKKRFFCSQFLLEAYRSAGVPITDADPRWISPADLLHMREGDVPSMRVRQSLAYIGHLKFREPLTLDEMDAEEDL